MIRWLSTQYEWLKSALNEKGEDKASFKRIASTAIIILFIVSYSKIAIPSETLMDIPDTWALLIGGIILGLGAIDKIKRKDQ